MKPFFIKKPVDVLAVVGESIEVPCRLGGDPLPVVRWRRMNGGDMVMLRKPNVLHIDSATRHDTDIYICEGENLVALVSTQIQITVKGRIHLACFNSYYVIMNLKG